MASPDVRILAPIPGRQAIGVEVPNVDRQLVAARRHPRRRPRPAGPPIRSRWRSAGTSTARPVLANLATMPHLLIAGATGAGKSSCLNSLITSILMRSTPDQVRHDPRRPQAGRDGPVQPAAAPAHPGGHQPEEGGQRAVVGGARRWSGATTCSPRSASATSPATTRRSTAASSKPEPGSRRRVPAAAVHPHRRRRADRPHDGRGPRRRGLDLPHRPDGPRRRHPPRDRHAAAVGERHHRRHQGQRPGPPRVRRVEPDRQPRDPRPAGRRAARSARATCSCSARRRRCPARIQGSWVTEDEVRKVVGALAAAGAGHRLRREVRGRRRRRRAPAAASASGSGTTTTTCSCRPWS